jgi:hypothetical protein
MVIILKIQMGTTEATEVRILASVQRVQRVSPEPLDQRAQRVIPEQPVPLDLQALKGLRDLRVLKVLRVKLEPRVIPEQLVPKEFKESKV